MLVFEEKRFLCKREVPKKCVFHRNAIITSGGKLCKIDVFEVRYLENDNGDPPFYYIF